MGCPVQGLGGLCPPQPKTGGSGGQRPPAKNILKKPENEGNWAAKKKGQLCFCQIPQEVVHTPSKIKKRKQLRMILRGASGVKVSAEPVSEVHPNVALAICNKTHLFPF